MKREPGMAYDTKVLNKIFAVVSVLFLFVTIWVVLDDYIRPWKAIQVKALDIEKQKIQEKIKEIDGSIDGKKIKEIKDKISTAEKSLESQKNQIEKINDKISEIDRKIYVQNMVNGVNGSQAAEFQFKYEHALMENHPEEAKKLKVNFDDYKKKEIEGKDNLKGLNAELATAQGELKAVMATKIEAEKELKGLVGDKERLLGAISVV